MIGSAAPHKRAAFLLSLENIIITLQTIIKLISKQEEQLTYSIAK